MNKMNQRQHKWFYDANKELEKMINLGFKSGQTANVFLQLRQRSEKEAAEDAAKWFARHTRAMVKSTQAAFSQQEKMADEQKSINVAPPLNQKKSGISSLYRFFKAEPQQSAQKQDLGSSKNEIPENKNKPGGGNK